VVVVLKYNKRVQLSCSMMQKLQVGLILGGETPGKHGLAYIEIVQFSILYFIAWYKDRILSDCIRIDVWDDRFN
jgi:hypothetical protein